MPKGFEELVLSQLNEIREALSLLLMPLLASGKVTREMLTIATNRLTEDRKDV